MSRLLLIVCVCLMAACTSDEPLGQPLNEAMDSDAGTMDVPVEDEPEGRDVVEPPLGPQPHFDLAAVGLPGGFYDYPFPSDLRLTGQGAPELSSFHAPENVPLTDLLVASIHRDNRGFSPLTGVYFRFDEAVDPASLPADPAATLEAGATAFVIDIDPSSPERGSRVPMAVHYRADAGRFWLPSTLVLLPLPGRPLRPGTLYGAVVRRGLKTASGEEFEAPEALVSLLGSVPPVGRDAEWENLRPLVEILGDEKGELLSATVFTTADPASEMLALRRWIHAEVPAPSAQGWEARPDFDEEGMRVYEGTFPALEFFSGEPPYRQMGEGIVALDEDGAPVSRREVDFRFTLSVPEGEAPEGGWPLALYSHGSGSDSRRFLRTEGPLSAEVGVAMVSIDHPMHGARDGVDDFVTYLVNLALSNPGAGREMYRHSAPDFMQLVRLVRGDFAVPEGVSHTGLPIIFDTGPLPFVGHSQGAQAGALVIGLEPDIGSAFLSAAGGGVASAFLLRKADGVDIEKLVALAMGIDLEEEPLGAHHPLVGLLIQPLFDGADPLHYAHLAIRTPPGGARAKHIFMTEGLEDPKTIPVTIEALAAAFGLPIVEPVGQASEVHDLLGIATQPLPAAGNVLLGPEPVTGVLIQFPEEGHSAFYRTPQAKVWYREWLRTSLAGAPSVSPP